MVIFIIAPMVDHSVNSYSHLPSSVDFFDLGFLAIDLGSIYRSFSTISGVSIDLF
ncbi:hypothetical protein HYV86_03740 [Candidatus Woesearchaeota archaeon]|nr:hypothetical protein [Candidatus Woesearchaeota archaeon]